MAINAGEGGTVIGRGATFRGDLRATEDVVVEGSVEGTIQADGARVTVSKEARVKAEIRAQEVVVIGRVEGNVRGSERVELRDGAVMLGDIFAQRFSMEEGSAFRGRVDPSTPTEAPVAGTVTTKAGAAPVSTASKAEQTGLFGGQPRVPGQMPAGLAAAARNLGSAQTPAGLNALSVDERSTSEDSSKG